ncbi:hypothetical protein UNDKW_5924 (plasmid) [Undibacterium sp. KW1]|uniref:hypothetical protein n=1 Tax=Undibacterium sp. KW1 TaxID=2058624 RepID=UPI001331EDFF|nr:hypothetical protein [Undibacterium sp. KW1]BBB64197.1 hypothetical protein UNDKW_5924 [Undibacterium sp. KW1]
MKIQELGTFPDDERSKISLIETMYEDIQRLKKNGLSYRTLAERITAGGLEVSEQALTSMLGRIKRKKRSSAVVSGAPLLSKASSNLGVAPLSPLQNSAALDGAANETRPYAHQKDGKLVADEVW